MDFLSTGSDYLKAHEGFKLVGREEDLKRLSSVLMRSKANSVLLYGQGGVGATALSMGLQASKNDEHAPFDIVAKRLFWLNTDDLFSSGNSGSINASWQKIMGLLRRTPESILFIEDFRDFIEGARNSGCSHFINSLANAVKNGNTQAVIEARDDDVAFILKSHSDFKECFTMIELLEPTGEALDAIVRTSAENLSRYHGIRIADDAIQTAIMLTNKYRSRDSSLSRAQPERSSNLLDRAMATFRLDVHKDTPNDIQLQIKSIFREMRDGEIAIAELEESRDKQLEMEKNRPTGDVSSDEFSRVLMSGGFESPAVAEYTKKINKFTAAVEEERKKFSALTASINKDLVLTKEDVMAEFSRITGIPSSKLNENELEKLKSLEGALKKRIFGQDPAMAKMANAIKIARVGGRHGSKPQAAFMLLGPSGVGKTECTKALADTLGMTLLRIDMSEYMEKHAVAKLIGAPPGYDGFENGGFLTNSIRKNPSQVVLFDEIEKASPEIFNILLQILSDGRLTDSAGLTVSFADTIVILTSNIGQGDFLDPNIPAAEALERALEMLMKPVAEGGASLRPELLNRFAGRQNIIGFSPLFLDSIQKIARREIESLDATYSDRGITTVMPEESLHEFCEATYDVATGARGLPGFIEANLEPIIVNTILDNPNFRGRVEVGFKDKKFTTKLVEMEKEVA